MNLEEANDYWFKFEPIEGVRFRLNDPVRIKSGEYKGQCGSVVSLKSVEPVIYLVELGETGRDVDIEESVLEPAE